MDRIDALVVLYACGGDKSFALIEEESLHLALYVDIIRANAIRGVVYKAPELAYGLVDVLSVIISVCDEVEALRV